MLAHPTGTGSSAFFSLLFYREMAKKYFRSSKWGSIPKYPSHSATKGRDVLNPIGVQVLQLNLVIMQL
jgi:hypothetical protein